MTVKKPSEGSQWLGTLGSLMLPLLFIIFLVVMAKSIQAGGSQAMSFGKSKAKMMIDSKVKTTFEEWFPKYGSNQIKTDEEIRDLIEKQGGFVLNP
jgi:cell division protease FtsH